MMTKTLGNIAVVALAVVGTACAHRAPPGPDGSGAVMLRFRPEPGRSFRTVSVMDASTSQTSMGRELHTHQVMTIVTRYDVDEPVNAGEAVRLRATWESVRVEKDGPGGHVTYDSSDPSSEVPWGTEMFAALVGRTITESVAADGTRKIEGVDSLMNDLVGRMHLPAGVSDVDFRRVIKVQLDDWLSPNLMQRSGSMLPDHPVSVGDSWTQSVRLEGPLSMHNTMIFTLRERRNGVAIIDMRTETATDSATTRTMGRTSMRSTMKGTGSGTMEVDEATGWMLRSTMETEVSTTVILEHSPAGRQEIPMTTHVVITTHPAGGA